MKTVDWMVSILLSSPLEISPNLSNLCYYYLIKNGGNKSFFWEEMYASILYGEVQPQ